MFTKGFFHWFGYSVKPLHYKGDINDFSATPSDILITTNLKFVLIIIIFATIVALWLSKVVIHQSYSQLRKSNPFKVAILNQISGAIVLIFVLLRSLMLVLDKYPNAWESLPLQYCRIMIVILGVLLLLNKPKLVKYIAVACVFGGLIALIIPDLSVKYFHNGPQTHYDNVVIHTGENIFIFSWKQYYFYDYFLAHGFVIIAPILLSIFYPFKITLKENLKIILLFTALILLFYLINYLSAKYATTNAWVTNYFYSGRAGVNTNNKTIKAITSPKFILITELVALVVYVFISSLFYGLQDCIKINWNKNKFIKITYSNRLSEYFDSFKIKKQTPKN